MFRIISFSILLLMMGRGHIAAQTMADAVTVHDTRATSWPTDHPDFSRQVRFDFKLRSVLGVPGTGNFSGLMTIAPWSDLSGDNIHQLNFNNAGIYYRQGLQGSSWTDWVKLLTSYGKQEISGPDDDILTFKSTESNSWQYVQYVFPEGRLAYMGISPQNDFRLVKENGGNIILHANHIGIGTDAPGSYKLAVEGIIGARKIRITQQTPWADFVFDPAYHLPSLYEVEKFIQERKHLPEIPTKKEVAANGFDVGEMNAKLLQKIEELTLYLIEQRKELDGLKQEIKTLKQTSK